MEGSLQVVEHHCFEQAGQWVALDVRRSRPYLLSALESTLLALAQQHTPEEIMERLAGEYAREDIEQALQRLVYLELLLPADQPLPKKPTEKVVPLTSLELNVAQDCNLGCSYCIVGQGLFGGPAQMMSFEVAKDAVDLLIRESGNAPSLFITLFGGEPMMNFRLIEQIVPYAEEQAAAQGKTIGFRIVTNGTLFTEKNVAFLKEHNVLVQVSLDGPQETHDATRTYLNGQGSYQQVRKRLPILFMQVPPHKTKARATLTHFNTHYREIRDHLREIGFAQAQLEPVLSKDEPYRLTPSDYDHLAAEYEAVAQEVVESGKPEFGPFTRYIHQFCFGPHRTMPCGAGRSMLGVAADGQLYPCKDLAEIPQMQMGHVKTGVEQEKRGQFLGQVDVDHKPVCKDCWARYLCGGSCASACHKLEGSAEATYEEACNLIRRKIELASWVQAKLAREKPQVFLRMTDEIIASYDPD